ncbi:related to ubiquitin-specific protease 22 [Cephalotrichum gorgonifer]|uniref:Related to ubiquitin-specific protease 22 n=1 Tax=Cephalotrichum gorgonifer TaxID=2041049 RepID=A0AAE8SXQ8_9PEZI|nr:related to ubiquitin-specific protease 22 [Cephalotrichum gorgonifer]
MATASSPTKTVRVNPPAPGKPMFGCEHLERLLTSSQDNLNQSIGHYKLMLRKIFDGPAGPLQVTKNANGGGSYALTSNYLCLQCPVLVTEEDRIKHGSKKAHRFYVDSRTGLLYCQMCDDLIWDPTLEELRIRKMGTASFWNKRDRKRKHEEHLDPVQDDPKYISNNTLTPPCRANGLRGIYNAGATCYQNVILQSFLHNPLLRNFYLRDGHTNCNTQHCLSCAMDDIFQDFYAVENTNGYTAANILSGFWISEKKAFENLVTTKEQDAHEFFQFLAEELHERNGDGRRPEVGSEHSCQCVIHQIFYGKMLTTTVCQKCNGATDAVQSFLDLSLGLETLAQRRKKGEQKPLTLRECLDTEYIKSDKCEYRCQGFQFPLEINMLPYTSKGRDLVQQGKMLHDYPELSRAHEYDLVSVVVHVGSIDTGHYIAYCRVGEQWFKFNDHKVMLATKSEVLSSQAYLLFYCVRYLS